MYEIIRPKSHEEWLNERKNGIGSSEIATILGVNPWETPYQLWRRKLGLEAPQEENFAMKAGHYLEDAVSRFYEDATGHKIIKASAGDWIARDKDRPFLQVSPDRTYWLTDSKKDGKGILECKTTQMSIDTEDLPKHWFCQLQMQLGVSNMEAGSLAWLCSGREFGYKELRFVPDFYRDMVGYAEEFWYKNIVERQEPAMTDIQDVLLKFRQHTEGKTLEVGEDIYDAVLELKDIKEQIAELDKKKDELEGRIKMIFEDAEAISYGGNTLATWRSSKPSMSFDAKRFEKERPEDVKDYMKEVPGTRRFIIK